MLKSVRLFYRARAEPWSAIEMGPALPAAETLMPLAACVYLSADPPILRGAAYHRGSPLQDGRIICKAKAKVAIRPDGAPGAYISPTLKNP